ncbi:hypothetical protein OG413_28685 [Streptomyces sp. NBC_01433]|nr:hypothetical protein [Streptomyces sp. NBC_01433]MCX4679227.1 hypothetical protein [Streptomyces sp. NBC_01433]
MPQHRDEHHRNHDGLHAALAILALSASSHCSSPTGSDAPTRPAKP